MDRTLTLLAIVPLAGAPHVDAHAHDAQPRPLPAVTAPVRALAGCYQLTAAPWSATPPGWPRPPALPAIVRLDTVPQRVAPRDPDFRAGPDLAASHELPFAPGWQATGASALSVSWWDGYTGPVLALRRRGASWEGTASFLYHGSTAAGPTATVRAVRVACPPATRPRR